MRVQKEKLASLNSTYPQKKKIQNWIDRKKNNCSSQLNMKCVYVHQKCAFMFKWVWKKAAKAKHKRKFLSEERTKTTSW